MLVNDSNSKSDAQSNHEEKKSEKIKLICQSLKGSSCIILGGRVGCNGSNSPNKLEVVHFILSIFSIFVIGMKLSLSINALP